MRRDAFILLSLFAAFSTVSIANDDDACPPHIYVVDGKVHGESRVEELQELLAKSYAIEETIWIEASDLDAPERTIENLIETTASNIVRGSVVVAHFSAFSDQGSSNESLRVAAFMNQLAKNEVALVLYSRAVRGDHDGFKSRRLREADQPEYWDSHLFIVSNARGVARWDREDDTRARADVLRKVGDAVAVGCPPGA